MSPLAVEARKNEILTQAKSAAIYPIGPKFGAATTCTKFRELTAEHRGGEPLTGISRLTFEWIINGQTLKLKPGRSPLVKEDLVLPGVWHKIVEELVDFSPTFRDQVKIFGIDPSYGGWTITNPEVAFALDNIVSGIQITAALLIEAIQEIIMIKKRKSNLVLVNEEVLEDYYSDTDSSPISNDILGFYSLLMSYVKIATSVGDLSSAKFLWSETTGEKSKTGEQVTTDPNAPALCGNPAATRLLFKRASVNTSVEWPTKKEDKLKSELAVKTWIEELGNGKDVLSVIEKLVWDGQIGGFGTRRRHRCGPRISSRANSHFRITQHLGDRL
ncbi:hypothetical protein K458DRAFT_383256 [Lentithecium fluviatile CBS 122367]|uniref:Uncharacterized protein n=1 Tax=Lentithecium fluviatile CBS 122367 TaxID=1168545 RepID=A0A6G1JHV2_9PLEO|nr:hypothetical protein K458DRAFT_383256 [Lentithecium fluviatile CBS 122367]